MEVLVIAFRCREWAAPGVRMCPRAECKYCFCFFFQAEDGIRDYKVTGVQTCALPIFIDKYRSPEKFRVTYGGTFYVGRSPIPMFEAAKLAIKREPALGDDLELIFAGIRSEERRGGEEGRYRWSPDH